MSGRGVQRTPEENRILTGGMTETELALFFGIRVATIRTRLAVLKPINFGANEGPRYRGRDAAPYLTRLPDDVVEQVMRLNHMDLPPMLRKEFWLGQKSRLEVEKAEGTLFDAATVVEYVGNMLKAFRMGLLLISDHIERDDEITPRQRERVAELMDQTLEATLDEATNIFGVKFDDTNGQPGGKPHNDRNAFERGTGYPEDWTADQIAEAENL